MSCFSKTVVTYPGSALNGNQALYDYLICERACWVKSGYYIKNYKILY